VLFEVPTEQNSVNSGLVGTAAGFTQNPFALPVMIIITSISLVFHFISSVLT
jgi:hypothetical protein